MAVGGDTRRPQLDERSAVEQQVDDVSGVARAVDRMAAGDDDRGRAHLDG